MRIANFDCKVGVFIPVLNAARDLKELLPALQTQDPAPDQVLFVDSSSTDGTRALIKAAGYQCLTILREDFGHGRTRNMALQEMDVDVIVYLTQDVIPCSNRLLEELVAPFQAPDIGHTVARQLPKDGATHSARFSRHFNYPERDFAIGTADFAEKGIRAIFTSNSCAAYRSADLQGIGGFVTGIPSNEDALAVAHLLQVGRRVHYCAEATVKHSHNYSLGQEFRRYFDTGVAHARHDIFRNLGGTVRKEGSTYVKREIAYFLEHAPLQLAGALFRDFVRWAGYQAGRRSRFLPLWLKKKSAMNKSFWINEFRLVEQAQ